MKKGETYRLFSPVALPLTCDICGSRVEMGVRGKRGLLVYKIVTALAALLGLYLAYSFIGGSLVPLGLLFVMGWFVAVYIGSFVSTKAARYSVLTGERKKDAEA